MIDRVIICGLRRAGNFVPEMEIRQMVGRGGRSYEKDAVGKVVILTSEEDYSVAEDYLYGKLPSILSKMDCIEDLAFHILPCIYSKEIYDDVTAYEWYRRTLAHLQSIQFPYRGVFNFLLSHEMIVGDDKQFKITELGKLSCKYYFSPLYIYVWKEKFEKLMAGNAWNDNHAVAWALATNDLGINVNKELMEMIEMNSYSSFEYDEKEQVAMYYCLFEGYRPKELKFAMMEHRKDIDRIIKVLMSMNGIYKWGIFNEIEILNVRIKERMDYNTARLALEINIYNKSLLYKLSEFGIRTFEDMKNNIDKIRTYGDKKMLEQLEETLNEFL